MGALIVCAVLGLTARSSGPTLAIKVRRACTELGIVEAGLTVPEALRACNEAMGIEASGPLLTQADALMWELGINFDAETPPPSQDLLPSPPRQAQGGAPMPSMVVFDLDFTLWKPELYQLSSGPPFTQSADGCVLTRRGERLDLFPAARKALSALADAGVPVAIASRASERAWAVEIMRLLLVDDRRTVADVVGSAPVVIQGGSKVHHLKHIAHESGVPLREMVFFDNERGNILEVKKIGPTCIYCPRGLTDDVFRDGVALHVGNAAAAASPKEKHHDSARKGSRRANAPSKDKKSGGQSPRGRRR